MPIDKVVEEEVKDKELEASKDYTGLIPEVESPSSKVSMLFVLYTDFFNDIVFGPIALFWVGFLGFSIL